MSFLCRTFVVRCAALAALVLLSVSCASYVQDTEEIRAGYRGGNYQAALEALEDSVLKTESNSALLYKVEKAMILDRLGERGKSRKLLIAADRLVDELYTVSISKTAASFVVNDRMSDYEGEDFEKVAIHTMLALSFLEDGDLSAARVEARRINTRLHEITKNYPAKHNSYKDDAFAQYLAGLIYDARGEYDDAIIDYRKALKLYEARYYSKFFRGPPPPGLVKALYRVASLRRRRDVLAPLKKRHPQVVEEARKELSQRPRLGYVYVLHEYGHISTKAAKEFIFGFGKQVIRFSFPYIPRRAHRAFGETGLRVAGTKVAAANVADMNAIAYHCLEERRGRMLLKGGARLLVKGQLTEQAHENFGPLGGLVANAFAAATETADTRSWTLLPEAFYVSRVALPEGAHDLEILTGGRTQRIATVNVKAGQLVLVRAHP